jgi:prepilin-type N-terminal cleavage/methylation domain-containing protein
MNAPAFPCTRRVRGGFTLLEMMITLAVFLLLAAAVFELLTGVLQSASVLQDNANRTDRLVALDAFLAHKLTQMPARSTIASYQRGDGEGLIQNGIVFGNTNLATAIDAKSQPNGLYLLRITSFATTADATSPQDARQVLNQLVTTDDASLTWTPLVKDIKTLTWRFQDASLVQWDNIWLQANTPNLVELSLQVAGDPAPTVLDYWVPLIQPVQVHIHSTSTSTTGGGNNASNPGGNNGSGGNNRVNGPTPVGGNTPRNFH